MYLPFYLLLLVVAFLYAAVGHGGASGYLALMALFEFSPEVMKPTALLLNIFVAGISFYSYYRGGFFKWKLFYPFALASIPAAFVGGMISIDSGSYKKILGILLIFAILRMVGVFGQTSNETKDIKLLPALGIGAVIGLFSGMIGIGGGIILSPVILLLSWGKMKETAAVSALFIWVNSVSGIIGQFSKGVTFDNHAFFMVGIAVIGGLAGGYFGSKKINTKSLTYILAFVLAIACAKLFLT